MCRGTLRRLQRNETARAVLSLSWRGRWRLLRRLLKDQRVPLCAKLIIPALVLYLLSPIDIVPDFIPVLGYVDDLVVLALAVWAFSRLANPAVVTEHTANLLGESQSNRPGGRS
ncbi:MAG: DUF1232 domain-containing protein [Chloroflexi bacterium]|nr:DUF1232 domain-containing protein [Chloroflexota bacterium]